MKICVRLCKKVLEMKNQMFWMKYFDDDDYDVDSRTVRATALQLGTKRVTVFVASLCKSEWDKFYRFACETNQMLYAHMHTHSDSHRAHKHINSHTQRDIWTNASSESNDMKQTKRQFRSTAFEVVNNVIYTTSAQHTESMCSIHIAPYIVRIEY